MESSSVWKYFIRDTRDSASCRLCKKELKCKGSSTTGLRRHLKSIHKFGRRAAATAALYPDDDMESQSIVVEEIKPVPSGTKDDLDDRDTPEYLDYEIMDTPNASDVKQTQKRNVLLELLDLHKEKKDEDALFLDSFLPTIRTLSMQDKMQFKMEFQQLLYKYVFKEVA
ncbi:uncharacterized protein LOC129797759 isoform X2 [Lutzomyia longipalpis]|uniref:uncharacterized protein LOC129797759 isoform X2 n=1 Tax=Lutzomyia longipalpis TaxID=7200 RepID=UPI002483B9EB|nr:uncharacterized protein LOC129797759 isoform X2 [Lutzomyia longipalpis]